jgi:hypothetical protein
MPHTAFTCPHCGAPGLVNMGQAEYSCLCRMGRSVSELRQFTHYIDERLIAVERQLLNSQSDAEVNPTGSTNSGEVKHG